MLRIFAFLFAVTVGAAHAQVTPGTSPLTIAKGGTNAATASTARTSLGLAIGSNVEAWDADLDCLAALGTTGVIQRTGAGTCAALTNTQLTALINTFTTTLSGAVPAPGSVAGKFLGDDGTWHVVTGTGTLTTLTAGAGILFSSGATCTTTCTVSANLANSSVTGASTTFTSAQNGVLIERSNSGSSMSDTLPGTSPGILPANTIIIVTNNDTGSVNGGLLAVSAGSGASIKGASLLFNGFVYAGPGQTLKFYSDGSNYWLISAASRAKLAASTTISVATTGNDSTANGVTTAFASATKAWNFAQSVLDLNATNFIIQIADGAYTAPIKLAGQLTGQAAMNVQRSVYPVIVQGNITTPDNVTVTTTGDTFGAVQILNGANVLVQGFKCSAVSAGNCIYIENAAGAAKLVDFGASFINHVTATRGSYFQFAGNYSISGNAQSHALESNSWISYENSLTVTFTTALTFTQFFTAQYPGIIVYDTLPTFTGTSISSGAKNLAFANGVINYAGGSQPGVTAGSTSTGGQVLP